MGRADAVGAQRRPRRAAGPARHPHRRIGPSAPDRRPRPTRRPGSPRSPRPAVDARRGAASRIGGLGPAGAADGRRRGRARARRPPRRTSPGATRPRSRRRCPGCGRPGSRRSRRAARPPRPAAASGRGARRPRGAHSTRTGRPCASASARAAAGTGEAQLAAEGPAVGERAGGLAAGRAPRRVGLEVGRLDPGRAQRQVPRRRRDVDRPRQRGRAAPALHLARRRPGRRAGSPPTAQPAGARRARPRGRRAARRVVGEPPIPERHLGADPLGRPAFERRPHRAPSAGPRRRPRRRATGARGRPPTAPTGGGGGRRRRRRRPAARAGLDRGVDDGPPPGAAAQVGDQRAGDVGCASAGRVGRSAARRTMIPGVQNPHWLAPWRANASAHRVRLLHPVERRRPTARRPGAPASRTTPAGDRRRARCSTRTGPAGCTRPWATAAPETRRAGPRAASRRRRPPPPGGRRRRGTGAPRELGMCASPTGRPRPGGVAR